MFRFRFAASVLFAVAACAQSTPAPDYAILNYYRALPAMAAGYEAKIQEKTVKLTQEVMKTHPELLYGIGLRLEFGGSSTDEPNYIFAQGFKGAPADLERAYDQAAKKLFNQSWADLQKEYGAFRTPVGRTIVRLAHRVGTGTEQGDWLRVQMNRTPGGPDEYVNIMKEADPLREAQVKAGKIRGLSLWGAVSNAGSEDQFSSLTVVASKDLASLIGSNASMDADNAKLTKPVNLASYVMRLNSARTVLHSDIFRAFVVIRPAQ